MFWQALARRVQRGRLKAYTLHRYKRAWALHLEPFFGGLAFADVTVADVEDWVDTEVDAGSSAKSIRNWHGLLHSIMAYGQQRQQLRADNPCAATELPEVDHKAARQVRFFTGRRVGSVPIGAERRRGVAVRLPARHRLALG